MCGVALFLRGELVFSIFERPAREQGQTIVVVTHDPRLAAHTDRIIRLQDGRVVDGGRGMIHR